MSEWRIEKHPVLSIPEVKKIPFYWNGSHLLSLPTGFMYLAIMLKITLPRECFALTGNVLNVQL